MDFFGKQPRFYGATSATSEPLQSDGFVGSVPSGGSVNCHVLQLIPHCNGTHTECVGHITAQKVSINNVFSELLFPATLISLKAKQGFETKESYDPKKHDHDLLITREAIEPLIAGIEADFLRGLVIRTMPNFTEKPFWDYNQEKSPYFSLEAITYLRSLNVLHLLLDFPSIDRLDDQGKLSAHRIFWDLEPGASSIEGRDPSLRTITEMVYVPDVVGDGLCMLNIQIPNFVSDAAPSRIFLYELCVEKR